MPKIRNTLPSVSFGQCGENRKKTLEMAELQFHFPGSKEGVSIKNLLWLIISKSIDWVSRREKTLEALQLKTIQSFISGCKSSNKHNHYIKAQVRAKHEHRQFFKTICRMQVFLCIIICGISVISHCFCSRRHGPYYRYELFLKYIFFLS